ncbi:MAG TPA: C1 family peptidase [Usitatibacter sp.]|nr:C1 family peptidase [Usitatibacter sp.]
MPRTAAARARPVLNVTPDRLDLRDRPYLPAVALAPPPRLADGVKLAAMQQGDTSACTGFALAAVVDRLLVKSGRAKDAGVSPWMLYSMARRYDEFPGAARDTGSSLRGALKGWFKHGACARALWDGPAMPSATNEPGRDWWLDAVNRPLGAYYRVDPRSVTDMHVALNEVGVLYGSVIAHAGWFDVVDGRIPMRARTASDGGHAFAIVGYDQAGFRVQNSWGEGWGERGFATLTYEDWLENAMDCWVAQLGVVTDEHRRVAASSVPGGAGRAVSISRDRVLQNHQLAPYVIDMENNGRLSDSGAFRTRVDDVRALATDYLDAARRAWKVKPGRPIDVALYVHGGLIGEADAAATFAQWFPALYGAKRFPIFLMWESDLASTLASRLEDLVLAAPRPVGGPLESLQRWWDERLEGMLAPAGTQLWNEMKDNARRMSGAADSGARILFEQLARSGVAAKHPLRLHLVGHSAGAIALAWLIDRLAAEGRDFETVTFLAPALRVDRFLERVAPWIVAGRIRRYRQYHLSDAAELEDPTCRPLLGYGRSLLYLVSRSFEGGGEAPILGMERHFPPELRALPNVEVVVAPTQASASTTHGGFDDDGATMRSVIAGMQ